MAAKDIQQHQFKKGQSGNPNGRPRKLVTLLKDIGYTKPDIETTIQNMMSMTIDELKGVWEDKNATVLEKTIAGAIRKSIEKGSLYSIETLLTRVYGKPKEQIEQKTEHHGQVSVNVNVKHSEIPLTNSEKDIK